MDIILVIVFLILTGYFLKRIGLLAEKDKVALNNVVLYIGIPALIFNSMLRNVHADELASFFKLTIFFMLVSLFAVFLSYVVGKKILKLQPKSLAAFILVGACSNTAFMGFPIIAGFYGTEGFTRAIFCDVASLFLIVGLAAYLGSKVGGHKVNVVK
ncbi:MAG: AEC family transporter [Methanimicrococcus sp.]|nr:AEC family transporter [Methanimicrococcus sp.]